MAIESAAQFRRMARTAVMFLAGALSLCGVGAGQTLPPISTGSVFTIPSSTSWGQIYKVLFYKGNVLALDSANSALYQLAPGATSWSTIVSGGPLGSGFNTEGMTMDAQGTLYFDVRYSVSANPSAAFWRVPYDSKNNTWDFTTSDGWGSNIVNSLGKNFFSAAGGEDDVEFVNNPAMDGSGTLYFMSEESPFAIYSVPVDNQGNTDLTSVPVTTIVSGLKASGGKLAIDGNGNIYFVERHDATNSGRVTGVFFIPSGDINITGSGTGDAEAQLSQIDNGSIVYAGLTLDAEGNLYLTSETNSDYDETFSGITMVPNTCGGAANVLSAACLDYSQASVIAPVGSNNPLSIAPNGYLWIPTYQHWTPNGSAPYSNIYGIVVWAPGQLNLGPSPTGAPGLAGTLFVSFNQAITPASIQITQPNGGADFVPTTNNPDPPSGGTTPTVPCTAGTAYTATSYCQYWVSLSAQHPGAISGLFTMSDSSGNVISGTPSYIAGIGQGPEASTLNSPQVTAMASDLGAPAQVAADAHGNVYVADPGRHGVFLYASGSSGATGVSVGSFASPTGVAVDGAGDVYVADTGNVYELPAAAGVEAAGTQVVIANGFGKGVSLAVDGLGDVFAADPNHGQVVEITNPAASLYVPNPNLAVPATPQPLAVGSGFTAPSAVATDNAGDVFIADGSNLWEVTNLGVQNEVTSSLASVTGLAVDASGSVLVAQNGGILRIPQLNGNLSFTSSGPVDSAITAPVGIALDQAGNIYVSDLTGGTPSLDDLQVSGYIEFGEGLAPTVATEDDLDIFNIGNEPLSVNGTPSFGGADASVFSTTANQSGTACDTTGATPVATGGSCAIGIAITPPAEGDYSGSISVPTNAGNMGGSPATASLHGHALKDLEETSVTVTLNPATTVYPGSTVITVNVVPVPTSSAPATTHIPSGTVTLTLTNTAQGSTQPPLVETAQATGDDTGTTATFNLTGLLGGTYSVTAAYAGNVSQLFQPSNNNAAPAALTVAQATPAITLSEPPGVPANSTNGVYYILAGSTTITLPVSVTSSVGTPTGTVAFMNGSQLADPSQGAVPLDAHGNASFSVASLAAGTYNITAVYSGDTNFAAGASSVVTFQIIPPSVLLSANPATISATAGTPVASTITLQSLVGFSATNGVNISCDNSTLPSASECTFSVPQPDLCAPSSTCTGTSTTTVTISTNIPVNVTTASRKAAQDSSPFALGGVFGLGLLGLAFRKRAAAHRYFLGVVCLTLLLAGAVLGFTGCTNSGYTHTPPIPQYTTPAGTYNVSILVTDENSGKQYSLPFTLGFTVKASQ